MADGESGSSKGTATGRCGIGPSYTNGEGSYGLLFERQRVDATAAVASDDFTGAGEGATEGLRVPPSVEQGL
jgi:hypothetical protein